MMHFSNGTTQALSLRPRQEACSPCPTNRKIAVLVERNSMSAMYLTRLFGGAVLALGFAVLPKTTAADGFPSASNLIQRVVTRSEMVAKAGETNHYAYEKRSLAEELDDKEKVTKSTEKRYNVV